MDRTDRIELDRLAAREPPIQSWLVRAGFARQPGLPPRVIALEGPARFVIGRDHQPEHRDPWISAEHAELAPGPEGWILRDLGSSNGTLHWGERIERTLLADGDVFETGGTVWVFRSQRLADGPPQGVLAAPLDSFHPGYAAIVERVRRVAPTRIPVMLAGPTGVGKEVLARDLHRSSGRSGPFVAINASAIQRTLAAAELFGVERGAHSLAEEARLGHVRMAEKGTLLLDEIGDMPLEVQAALLRMIQESEVTPVGADGPRKIDVRVVCAAHQDLAQAVEAGTFRADLYARLNGVKVVLPTLQERVEDVGLLVGRFLERLGAVDYEFSAAAYRALFLHAWPFNIRELEKAVEGAVALAERPRIELRHLPEELAAAPARHQDESQRPTIVAPGKRGPTGTEPAPKEEAAPKPADDEPLEQKLVRHLTAQRGNISAVARAMGCSRVSIHRWLARYGLRSDDFRGPS